MGKHKEREVVVVPPLCTEKRITMPMHTLHDRIALCGEVNLLCRLQEFACNLKLSPRNVHVGVNGSIKKCPVLHPEPALGLSDCWNLDIGKVRVLEGSSRRDALGWIVHHELLEQIDANRAELCLRVANVLPALGLPLGEGWLEVGHVRHTWPGLGCGCAQLLADLEDRVDLGVAGEQRIATGHLGEDA